MSKSKNAPDIPALWEDSSLRAYLGEIRRRHGIVETLALPSMRDLPPLRIETLFVQPLLAETAVSADSDPRQWPEGKSLLDTLQEYPQLVVLGDPGGGKTTLSNWLAWRLSAGLTTPLPPVLENRVPLPCVLREMPSVVFAPDTTIADLAESIATRLLGDKADAALKASLRARVEAGSYVLILDGVDEIPVTHRKIVSAWVREAYQQNACVLATSRIVGYEDGPVDRSDKSSSEAAELAQKGLFGHLLDSYQSALVNKPGGIKTWPELIGATAEGITTYTNERISPEAKAANLPIRHAQLRYLMPFDQVRIEAFAGNWYRQRCGSGQEARQKASDLLASLAQSDATRQLARTPNLLGLMAIVHRERAHLPDGKALLYDEIANAYINTIDAQRKIAPDDILARYGWEERRTWLAYVGFRMQQLRGEQQEDDKPKDDKRIEEGVLASEKDVLDWLAEAMQLAEVEQPEETARLFLHWVARRSGLLLPRGEGRYAFVHLSFQEFFCAWHLYGVMDHPDFIVRDGESQDGMVAEIRINLWRWSYLPAWRETLIYLFELLSAKRNPHWVKVLVETLFGSEAENTDLYGNRVALVARLLTDRHIRLGEQGRDNLAGRCLHAAQLDFAYHDESTAFILPILRDAGYAAVVGNVPRKKQSNTQQMHRWEPDFPSLDQVTGKTKLRYCFVVGKRIDDIAPLADFVNLRGISLDDTSVSDLSPLSGLANLHFLSLDGTRVASLEPLVGLVNLKQLSLAGTQVADLKPLEKFTKISHLHLSGTRVSDLSPLAGLVNLAWLTIGNTPVADIGPLAGLIKLEGLFIGNTGVTDITHLSKLVKLQFLGLNNTNVTDVTPLAELKNLYFLNLEHTPVSDISPLSGLVNLERLDLSHTQVVDVTSLDGLPRLKIIHPIPEEKTSGKKRRKARVKA